MEETKMSYYSSHKTLESALGMIKKLVQETTKKIHEVNLVHDTKETNLWIVSINK